jgi:hypothetical protein
MPFGQGCMPTFPQHFSLIRPSVLFANVPLYPLSLSTLARYFRCTGSETPEHDEHSKHSAAVDNFIEH